MRHLYLLRHGQSEANAHHIVAGSHESPLSPVGERQSEFAGQTLRQYFPPIDLILSSPMSRACRTAEIIAKQINYPANRIRINEDLRERTLGEVEGKDYLHAPQHNGNYEDAENVPGVEPIEHLHGRVARVLQELYQAPEQNILVVCHNGCGRMLRVATKSQQPLDMYNQPRLENAIIYQLA